MKASIKKLPKSEVEIEGEIPSEVFESYLQKALKKLGENFEIDGFRKGKVPQDILADKIGEARLLEEMAEMALGEHYPKIIEEEKIDAIGHPSVTITKLARKNPLGFKIKTATLPYLKLPNYKELAKTILSKITKEEKSTEATEEDIENTIMDIRKSRAPKKHITEVATEIEGTDQTSEEELPMFDDEFVKSLGPFENVVDFKEKLKVNIKLEKENQQREKTRLKIIEGIIADTEVEIPEILIEAELDKILYKMESDISQMGLKFEDYLKHLNKQVADLRTDFRADADKRAKLALVLNEIAKVEKIVADQELVNQEVAALLEHYKDADKDRARMHAEGVLTNEKIFQFLENQ